MKKEEITEIIKTIFPKKNNLQKASSTLLNFIVKSKRKQYLKEKIQKNPPKTYKKIDNFSKEILPWVNILFFIRNN